MHDWTRSRWRPITRLSVIEQYRLDPLPAALERLRGVHPRLYLDSARIAQLREAVDTTHRSLWDEVRAIG